jgi:acetyltransferase-like isoleucine patch superfamily enzyme
MISKIFNKLIVRQYIRFRLRGMRANIKTGVNLTIGPFDMIKIGDNFFCGDECRITTSIHAKILIGNNVMFGPEVKIISGNHDLKYNKGHINLAPANKNDRGCIIEEGVWVGAGAIILDGAIIGEGAVIGAGSVVRGYVPPYTVYIGNPAIFYKKRFNEDQLLKMISTVSSKYTINSLKEIYRNNNCE